LTIACAALLLIGLGEGFYGYRLTGAQRNIEAVVNSHGDMLQKLSRDVEEAKGGYAGLRDELASTNDRLGATQASVHSAQLSSSRLARQHSENSKQWSTQINQLRQEQIATNGAVGILSSDMSGVKDGLNSANQQIASTRTDLQRAIGDLGVQSGLIATNRAELNELKMRGERDYVEFDVTKAKQPSRIGAVAITVKKTDTKRQRYTINLISDDRTIEKKDKTVNEPVQFYQSGNRQPTEIVVNQIDKNRIVGYIAFPKRTETRPALSEKTPEAAKSADVAYRPTAN
jgi:chromosome segregation ATPase